MARLLQLSDLHVVPAGALASGVLNTQDLLKKAIDFLIERKEAIGPLDAVLITGDISDDGSAESYKFAREQLERLKLPLLPIPGNHDAREEMRTAFSDLDIISPQGPINWTVDFDQSRIIGLDTLIEGQGKGRLAPESLNHLENALRTSSAEQIVVALHHPPLTTGIKFMDNIGLENRIDLENVVRVFQGEVLFVAGHVHGVHHGSLMGHPVITVPAVCSGFPFDCSETAPIGFHEGPRGCAIINTAVGGLWTMVLFDHGQGPYAF